MRLALFTYLFLTLASSSLFAQVGQDISNGVVNISLNSNGLFFNRSGISGFETPAGSGKQMVNFSSFWLSAIDPTGKFRQSVVINPLSGVECWPGPIDTFKRSAKTDSVWDHIWMVDREMIQAHRKEYNQGGYIVPDDIKSWPGSTKKGDNLPAVLAPYYDLDANAEYDCTKGDFPCIMGNQASYFICNDVKGEHVISAGPPLTAEMQLMTYFVDDPLLKDVVFINAFVINRSDFLYKDFYIGFYTDMVLGNKDDNFVGTDVGRNMIFGYNADGSDEGTYGYGNDVPAFGVQLLNQKISSSNAFFISDISRDFPKSATQVRNAMEGKWIDGTNKSMNGIGTGIGVSTKYLYAGKTDPLHPEIDWRENQTIESGGVRNMLVVSGPYQLGIGQSIKVDLACMTVRNVNHLSKLEDLADRTKTYYQTTLNVEQKKAGNRNINMWPNPLKAGENLKISADGREPFSLEIRELNGKSVYSSNNPVEEISITNLSELPKGFYIVEIKTNIWSRFEKLIIQ